MVRTITISDLMTRLDGVSTATIKDNSARGCTCRSKHDVKPGDKVLLSNYFTLVIADNEEVQA